MANGVTNTTGDIQGGAAGDFEDTLALMRATFQEAITNQQRVTIEVTEGKNAVEAARQKPL